MTGKTVWLHQRVVPVPAKDGSLLRQDCVIVDVTDRREAEQALRDSEARFRMLSESALTGVYVIQDDAFRYVNPALAHVFGYTPSELIGGVSPMDLVHEDDHPTVAYHLRERLEGRVETVRETFRGLRSDGSVIYCESLGRRIDYENRPAIIGTLVDITDRKRSEEALRTSEENYRAIFNAANDAIFVHDAETGEFLDVNDKVCEMYGYTREEFLRLDVEALSAGEPPYTQADALSMIRNAACGEPQLFEWWARNKAGELFWVEVSLKRANVGERGDCSRSCAISVSASARRRR